MSPRNSNLIVMIPIVVFFAVMLLVLSLGYGLNFGGFLD